MAGMNYSLQFFLATLKSAPFSRLKPGAVITYLLVKQIAFLLH
jgi:hypothetical protein